MPVKTLATIVIVLVLIVAGVVAIGGPQLRDRFSGGEDEGTVVRVEPASVRRVIETVAAPGEIRPLFSVNVAAEVSARIVELPVNEGDAVEAGQLLARLDGSQLEASLRARRATRDGRIAQVRAEEVRLAGVQSRIEFARRDLERVQSLFDSGDVPSRELDTALERVDELETQLGTTRQSLAQLESSLLVDEAEIQRAEASLSNTVIVSPRDGRITRLNVELGEVVTGSTTQPGTVLMTIADLRRMVHDAEVAESDVARVEADFIADVHINGYPDRVFTGRVRRVALQRSTSANGGFFVTEIEIDRDNVDLRSGHLANAEIRIAEHEELAVPYQAIVAREIDDLPASVRESPLVDRTRRSTLVVFRLEDGVARAMAVEAGPSDLTHRVVYAGIEPGTPVIVGPYSVLEKLEDGDAVKMEGADDAEDGAGDGAEPTAVADADTAADRTPAPAAGG
jgi:HlyD family secretion protein